MPVSEPWFLLLSFAEFQSKDLADPSRIPCDDRLSLRQPRMITTVKSHVRNEACGGEVSETCSRMDSTVLTTFVHSSRDSMKSIKVQLPLKRRILGLLEEATVPADRTKEKSVVSSVLISRGIVVHCSHMEMTRSA